MSTIYKINGKQVTLEELDKCSIENERVKEIVAGSNAVRKREYYKEEAKAQ